MPAPFSQDGLASGLPHLAESTSLNFTNLTGVPLDEGTRAAFGVVVLAHETARALTTDTSIGRN